MAYAGFLGIALLKSWQDHGVLCGRLAPASFAMCQSGNNTTKASHLLLGKRHPGKHCPQILDDRRAFFQRIKESQPVELGFEVGEEAKQLLFLGRPLGAKVKT